MQSIFGILDGIGAEPRNLPDYAKETADKLFGDQYVWSVLAGRHQMAFTTMAGINRR